MRYQISILIFLAVFLGAHCASDESANIRPLNPNGDSELALLMRSMFDDALRMKGEIKAGKKPEILEEFEKIHTAEPTDEDMKSNPAFGDYAKAYLVALETLKSSSTEDAKADFVVVVNTCMNCHQAVCPGPMRRIKKLYFE